MIETLKHAIGFLSTMPSFVIVLFVVVAVGILFAIFRRLIKFAFTLAALAIVILVILKLLDK